MNFPGFNHSFSGMPQQQFDYLTQNYGPRGFISDPSRIDNYSNPAINVADRNWQEVLRSDPGYNWGPADQQSWKTNCNFGPHNAGPALDSFLFKK